MKKIFAIVLAVCMVMSLAACGGGGSTPANNAANTTPANNSVNTTPANNSANTEPNYRGTVSGNVYINEPMDLKISLSSEWNILNEEQIAQQQGYAKELFGSDIADAVSKTSGLMIFSALEGAGLNNMNIVLQKSNPLHAAYSDEKIFSLMQTTLEDQMKGAGMKLEKYEILKATFCGEEKSILHTVLSYGGTAFSQYQIWVRPQGDYYTIITITGPDMTSLNKSLSNITHADGKGASVGPEPTDISGSTPETPVSASDADAIGSFSGNVYSNKEFGVRVTVPKSWSVASTDQLAAQNGVKVTDLSKMDLSTDRLVFYAQDPKTGTNVNILVNKTASMLASITDDNLFSIAKESSIESLKQQGWDVKTYEVIHKTIAGKDYGILHMAFEGQGIKAEQYQVWMRTGEYILVTTGGGVDYKLNDFLGYFSKLGA